MTHIPTAPGYNWDGSRTGRTPRRLLRIHPDSLTTLIRAARMGICRSCGNPVEWCQRADGRQLPLHPAELPARHVPPYARWHLAAGIAHPTDDGTPWCRIAHPLICPASPPGPGQPSTPQLRDLRRHLAIRTRRLTDNGFQSAPPRPPTPPEPQRTDAPWRPVVRLLHTTYLAPAPLTDLRCTAQTLRRARCLNPVHDHHVPSGQWRLLPVDETAPLGRQRHLAAHLVGVLMAVYDLTDLPYGEQLRWRGQRCPAHASTQAADVALARWEIFDPFLHHQHIRTSLPSSDGRAPTP
ncbi:DUF6083 domain-containing protein [Kitasatospora sp. NPDC101801]|uniref:DUF6083 domain-containing protein n=1 Tax=Kitasatospora sp. NPDC101801 TaxID=3364103 RepID=UPI0038182C8E